MARKNRTPEEKARREKIRELLQMANIGSMEDIQSLFKETIAEFMENGLDPYSGYLRYFGLGQHGQPDHGQDPACGQRVAAAAFGVHLRRGIFGCHPLPCPQRGADRKEGGVYCHRH